MQRCNKKLSINKKCIWIYALVFFVSVIPTFFLSSIVFVDELGTVGNLSAFFDLPWTEFIGKEGFFYKYGQALIYTPALFFSSYDVQFKVMLLINAFIIAFIPTIVYQILNRHIVIGSEKQKIGLSLCIGLLPNALLLSKYVWAESILFLLTWVCLFLCLECLSTHSAVKKNVYSILLGFCSMYAFASHQRGVVIVIAVFLVAFFSSFILKQKMVCWWSYIISLLFWGAVDKGLTNYFSVELFGGSAIQGNTVETSLKLDILKNIFTLDGIKIFIKEWIGWALSIFDGTMGLAFVGVLAVLIIILDFLKKKNEFSNQEIVIAGYSILVFLGAFLLGTLFFYEAVSSYYLEFDIRRGDRLIYSRYLDSVVGPVCLLGLYIVCFKNKLISKCSKWILCILSALIIVVSYVFILQKIDGATVWLNTILSVSLFVDTRGLEAGYVNVDNLSIPILLLSLVVLVLCIVILSIKKGNRIIVLLITAFLITYGWNTYNIVYKVNNYYNSRIEEASDKLNEIDSKIDLENQEKKLFILEDLWRISFRFAFDDYEILTFRSDNTYKQDNYFIVASNEEGHSETYMADCYEIEGVNQNSDLTNIYFKGEKLKQQFEEKGLEVKIR